MVSRIFFLLLIVSSSSLYAQKRGLGLRLGDPIGASYKRYFGMTAFEIVLGSSSGNLHQRYYERSFEAHDRFNNASYRSHDVRSTLYLQGRYLMHNAIWFEGLQGNWDWYWGVGAMFKFAPVRYGFTTPTTTGNTYKTFNDVDLGPEGIAGMEYTFQDTSITVFGDISLVFELVNRITLRPFAATGVRYNF